MSDLPIMAKATAVWLCDNTTLTFKQIADFCGLHELEVQGIADGDVATGVKGFDPIANNQLTQEEAPRSALHTAVKASGSSGVNLLAGQIPPRAVRRSGIQTGWYHKAHHSGDTRPHALEHQQP